MCKSRTLYTPFNMNIRIVYNFPVLPSPISMACIQKDARSDAAKLQIDIQLLYMLSWIKGFLILNRKAGTKERQLRVSSALSSGDPPPPPVTQEPLCPKPN